MINNYLFYQIGKSSSFGQGCRFKSIKKNWDTISHFLEKHTEVSTPDTVILNAAQLTPFDESGTKSQIEKTVKEFGPSQIRGEWGWEFPFSQLSTPLDYLLSNEPWPKQVVGPITLRIVYRFKWKNISYKNNPNLLQMHQRSSLHIHLARNTFIQPTLIFPEPISSLETQKLLSKIIPDLPFKFIPNKLRNAIPTKRKADFSYKVRKLSEPETKILKEIMK